MNTREEPGVLLRRRLHENRMSQADAARLFGKSRAWASQELFSDPQKTLRRMLIDQPAALDAFAKALGWSGRDELLQELNVFEGTALEQAGYPNGSPIKPVVQWADNETLMEIPDALQRVLDRLSKDYVELADTRSVKSILPRFLDGGGPQTEDEWRDYILGNLRWIKRAKN